ncbi:MAG: hypothetical protein Q4D04_11585 [Clostridia bacterium]|nr:hypothetical protein [Clostridia bacterium]
MQTIFFTEFKRAIISWRFALAAVGIPVTRLLGSTEMFTGDAVSTMIFSNDLYEIAIAFAALPFVADFAQSMAQKSYVPYVLRCGKNAYVVSKLLVLIFATFLANMVGQTIYIGVLGMNEPLTLSAAESLNHLQFSAYFLGGSLYTGNPYPFFLGQILASGVVCVEFAVMSFLISVFCSSSLFVYATPFLLYLFSGYVFWSLGAPYYLVPSSIYEGWLTDSPLKDCVILFGHAAIVLTLFGGAFIYFARRRIADA